MEVSRSPGYIKTLFTLILLVEHIQVELSILKTWMCTCMPFLNSSDKAHGKKLRCHNFSPKDLQTEIVASSKSFKSALGEGEKKIKNGYTSNYVPVLEVKILYKTVVKYF